FLQTLPTEKGPLDQEEDSSLKNISNLFQLTKVPLAQITSPQTRPISQVQSTTTSPDPKTKPPPPEVAQPTITEPAPKIIKAKTGHNLPFPQTPQTPNLLVGMVLNQTGKIIENAIIEIRNSQGVPVRALKTNKLGQFRIATPLKNEDYEIETEKEGFLFDIIKLKLTGKSVLPIEIRAK
ncbi:carboxypeptidase-like regulatory domain-containing protein, partial [Patescibacteria group bacterium]